VVKPLLGRLWFAGTALVVALGLLVQLVATARLDSGFFDSRAGRIVNLFCFFTIQSNIIVLVTCALLAAGSARRPTGSTFWVLRLDGVICIAVTFVVFHVALSDLHDLRGLATTADFLLHTASPLLCVIGWLVFGPRGRTSWRRVWLAAIFPVAWLVFALVRGPLVGDYYPYPFLDVDDHGYPTVLVSCAVVAALFLGLAAGAHLLDRRLDNRLATRLSRGFGR
jgi:general stress protein CsbA